MPVVKEHVERDKSYRPIVLIEESWIGVSRFHFCAVRLVAFGTLQFHEPSAPRGFGNNLIGMVVGEVGVHLGP
ncbi:MAG: hypothetical protein GXP36_02215 [Actinobacteria bacterium]|nr:hypothetical protein [Actinomycetota bacterium]